MGRLVCSIAGIACAVIAVGALPFCVQAFFGGVADSSGALSLCASPFLASIGLVLGAMGSDGAPSLHSYPPAYVARVCGMVAIVIALMVLLAQLAGFDVVMALSVAQSTV